MNTAEFKSYGIFGKSARQRMNAVVRAKKKKKNISCTRKDKYERHMHSKYWLDVRRSVFERDAFRCVKCGSLSNLHAHHLTYKNIFNEANHLEDVITLCGICHRGEHLNKLL